MTRSPLSTHRHMVDGTFWIFLAESLLMPTGIITTIILTRWLGPADYGLFILAATLVAWIETGINSLFNRTTVKFVSQAADLAGPVGSAVVRLYLLVSVGGMLLLWLLAAPIATLLHEPALAAYLWLFALDIPLLCLARGHRSILVGLGNFRQRALTGAVRWMARLLLIMMLVGLGFSVSGAILGSIGASLVELVLSRYFVRPSLLGAGDFPLRPLWGYAAPLFLFALSLLLFGKLDLFALKTMGGTAAAAGIYGAAQSLTRLPRLFVRSLSPVLLSTLSHTLQAGEVDLAKEVGRNALRFVILLLPLAGLVAGASPEIIGLIFGPDYLPAAPLLAVLMFGVLAQALITIVASLLIALGKPNWPVALAGPMLPAALIGHLLLIPLAGAVGAALVTSLVAGGGMAAALLVIYRAWRVWPPIGTVCRAVVACGLAFGLAIFWPTPGLWLLLKLPGIVFIVLLVYLLLGEISAGEIALVRSMLPWSARFRPKLRKVS